MLQKRRLTVHPVDAAQFCGCDNGMIVSFLNGIDHLVLDPAATDQDEAHPLPSRLLAHTYTGARLADIAVDTQRECVVEAAVSAAAVVACRVAPLTASRANPTAAYPVRATGASTVVFFAGCQRLAEVRLGDNFAGADAADAAACPMQCLRVESRSASASLALDIAAFVEGSQTLCTCTPQLGKLQTIRFDDDRICCMGPGRVSKAEVTVVLSSGVAVLCGVQDTAPSTMDENEEAALAEGQQAIASSSSSSAVQSAAARRGFAAANARSNVRILHTIRLPTVASPSDTNAAAPCRVAWSGASTLWVVYTDGTVVAVQCSESTGAQDAARGQASQNEESQQSAAADNAGEPSLVVRRVLQTQLTGTHGEQCAMQDFCTNADPRSPVLHIAFTAANASVLYYGTLRVGGAAVDEDSNTSVQWRLQSMLYDEQLYGVRLDRGRYHILTQGARGSGPLNVAVLPRDAVAHASQTGAAAEEACLARAIMASPEAELGGHCRTCEGLLRELHLAAQQLTREADADAVLHRLMQAQHALYALLRRQQASQGVTDLDPSESLPHRLLQRAARLHRQVSTHVLLLRLGLAATVTRPLHEVLRLEAAAAASRAAQAEWTSLMRGTFRSASVYQSSVVELAMWQASTALCVDSLLSRLGLAQNDAACTMAAVLSKMDSLTAEYALFILYYSYHAMGCAGDADVVVPPPNVQQQQRQWRESFLVMFGQPAELNAWAFACYAVDHGINPAQPSSDEALSPMLYVLGSAVHHLGQPPYAELLPAVLNGLAHVVAVDVLLNLIPSCLTVYAAARATMPISVTMRLLCVAVRTGSHHMIESLYEVVREDPLLQDLAAQPLAFAALAARDVSGLRGWVEVGSPVADTIERTLQASENIQQREAVLISFYILMQRYEDALRVCTSASAATADPTQAQRLQVVHSYLRSLLPAASEAPHVLPDEVDVVLPVNESMRQTWRPTVQAAPVLASSSAALVEEMRRATAVIERGATQTVAVSSGAASAATAAGRQPAAQQSPYTYGGLGSLGTPPKAKPPVFRPSTLLTSVEGSAGSRGTPSPSLSSAANVAYAR